MATEADIRSICNELQSNYSACDIADALLTLKVPSAGALPDLTSIQSPTAPKTRLVAPVSTVLYTRKSDVDNHTLPPEIRDKFNLQPGQIWTDAVSPGTITLVQGPQDQAVALIGDIIVTRLQYRGIRGLVVDGRSRDVQACEEICAQSEFQVWSTGVSAAPPSEEAVPWAVDVPLTMGKVSVKPGDVVVLDEAERALVVVPRELLGRVLGMMPGLREASEGVLGDVRGGMGLGEAIARHPGFYTNLKK